MSHDQLFKDLLRAFFPEFITLFFPLLAARLDLTRVTFLDKEVFTDLPQGRMREADLVAQVRTREGAPGLILVHIEIEAERDADFPLRMHEYYMLLRLRYRNPVFPVAIYLSPGAGGLTVQSHVDAVFDDEVDVFRYRVVGLRDLEADGYLEAANPLAPALAALMRPGAAGAVGRKLRGLAGVARSDVDEARQALLLNVIETYAKLNEEQEAEFRARVGAEDLREVREMMTVYEQRGIEKGERHSLLEVTRLRFGRVPERLRSAAEAATEAELEQLLERVVRAESLAETGLDDPSPVRG